MYMDLCPNYNKTEVLKLEGKFKNGDVIYFQNHLTYPKAGYYKIIDAKTYKDAGLYICEYLY